MRDGVMRIARAAAVWGVALGVYLGVGVGHPSGDSIPNKLVPLALLANGTLDLDPFAAGIPDGKRYCLVTVDGHARSSYPLGAAFTALPVFAAADLLRPGVVAAAVREYLAGEDGNESAVLAMRLERLAAAVIAAGSVLFLWRLTGAGGIPPWGRGVLTVAYAFGTSLFSSGSQALWTHGASCLWLMIMLAALFRGGGTARALLAAGAAAGWAVFCRPTNAVPLAVLGVWVLLRERRRAAGFVAGGLVVVVAMAWLNFAGYGHVLGGAAGRAGRLGGVNLAALAGVLVSPSRGLLVYSPFLCVPLVAGAWLLRRAPAGYGAACWVAALAYIGFYAGWPLWGGGASFGPRLLTDVLPFIFAAWVAAWPAGLARAGARAGTVALVAFGCLVHGLGARGGDRGWNGAVFKDVGQSALWRVPDSQLVWTLGGREWYHRWPDRPEPPQREAARRMASPEGLPFPVRTDVRLYVYPGCGGELGEPALLLDGESRRIRILSRDGADDVHLVVYTQERPADVRISPRGQRTTPYALAPYEARILDLPEGHREGADRMLEVGLRVRAAAADIEYVPCFARVVFSADAAAACVAGLALQAAPGTGGAEVGPDPGPARAMAAGAGGRWAVQSPYQVGVLASGPLDQSSGLASPGGCDQVAELDTGLRAAGWRVAITLDVAGGQMDAFTNGMVVGDLWGRPLAPQFSSSPLAGGVRLSVSQVLRREQAVALLFGFREPVRVTYRNLAVEWSRDEAAGPAGWVTEGPFAEVTDVAAVDGRTVQARFAVRRHDAPPLAAGLWVRKRDRWRLHEARPLAPPGEALPDPELISFAWPDGLAADDVAVAVQSGTRWRPGWLVPLQRLPPVR